MENAIRDTDNVLIRLTLRGRSSQSTVELNEQVTVADLGFKAGGGMPAPVFDTAKFAEVIMTNPEEAIRMQADFADATAEYLASGQATGSDALADVVVNWVLKTRPHGHNYTINDSADGYVISSDSINIAGPMEVGDERFWRVTAVGTWGY